MFLEARGVSICTVLSLSTSLFVSCDGCVGSGCHCEQHCSEPFALRCKSVCVCVCLSVLGHCLSCRECHTALAIVRANAHVCTHQVFPQQRSETFAVFEHMPRDLSFAVRFAMSSDVMSHLIRVSGACSPHPCAPPPHPPHQAKGPHGEPLELTEGCNGGGRSSRLAGTPLFVAAARKRSHGCCVVMTS